eukprot:TRINITY_DN4240_c0_g1_i3.p1 TRINITY_DN4240_c0_g1~~TRINITY_DN4240_c0_g1_i3.p1  ORF type:complete len:140 (+),score=12.63 TRINITY_DN4240_c0_g1_i3:135-554(+)
MIRRPPRSTLSSSSAASDVYKRQTLHKFGQSLVRCLFLHLLVASASGSTAGDDAEEEHNSILDERGDLGPEVGVGGCLTTTLSGDDVEHDGNNEVHEHSGEEYDKEGTPSRAGLLLIGSTTGGRVGTCLLYTSPSPRDS